MAVVHRYGSGLPIPGLQDWLLPLNMSWAQELSIIMFVWMAKFGAAYGVRTGIHVGVDVLINRLNDKMRAKFIVFGLLRRRPLYRHRRHAGCRALSGNGTMRFHAGHVRTSEADHPDLEWPTWIVYLRHSAGLLPDVFPLSAGDWSFLKTGELPHHDHGHVDGLEEDETPVDLNWYEADDDCHLHDLIHKKLGADGQKGMHQ